MTSVSNSSLILFPTTIDPREIKIPVTFTIFTVCRNGAINCEQRTTTTTSMMTVAVANNGDQMTPFLSSKNFVLAVYIGLQSKNGYTHTHDGR